MKKGIMKVCAVAMLSVFGISTLYGCSCGGKTPEKQTEETVEKGEGELPTPDSWNGVTVISAGNNKSVATLQGKGISVVVDSETESNVLKIDGEGYLMLPEDIWANIKEGFTVSYKYKADADSSDGANVFQTNIGGNGTGDTVWRDAPELSLNVGGTLKVYVGGRTINGTYSPLATYNNGVGGDDLAYAEPGGHKTRYTATIEKPAKDVWNEVVISVSSKELHIYVNGEEKNLTKTTETDDIASSLEYLFGTYENGTVILKDYCNTTIGNSVYSDVDNFKGYVDDICIYDKALSGDEVTNLPEESLYKWHFSSKYIKADAIIEESDLTKYLNELSLTEVPELEVKSPDSKTKVQFRTDADGKFYYSVTDGEQVIVESSLVGMKLEEGNIDKNLKVKDGSVKEAVINESYDLITGTSDKAENKCNEKSFVLANDEGSFTFTVRVYDDGVAYRYTDVKAGTGEQVKVNDELSEIIFPDNATTWGFAINGTYEGEYVKRSNAELKSLAQLISTPMIANVGNYWVLVTEAAAVNNGGEFCTSGLETKKKSDVLQWTFGLKRDPNKESTGELDSPGHINITEVNTVNGFDTPWRALVISEDMNEYVNSTLIYDLNSDADATLFADTSWIKPGKVAWSWWAEDGEQGNYDKHIEYIDFAAENGWEYVCMDVGWRAFESRLSEICDYAAGKGVGLFVWVNYRDIKDKAKMEELFKKWKDAGAVGLKTDYFESDDTDVLKVMEDVAICSAQNQLMLVYHGCVRPAGESRTYPHILTVEAVQGQEWHKWNPYPTVENCLMYTFTRNICGPMDFTPVATKVGSNDSTYGFGLAQSIVYESALQHFAYAAASYKNYTGLALINNIPTTWNETKLVEGYPGEYVTVARRNGENWFIGSMTLEERKTEITLDFLGDGVYNAYIYGDNKDCSALCYEVKEVKKSDVLTLELADNGGAAVMITKGTIDTTVGESEDFNNPDFTYYEAENSVNTFAGTAVKASSAFCSGSVKVGYVGNGAGNTLTFNKITVDKAGTYKIMLFYCCGENRKVTFTVNGDKTYELTGLFSGDYVHPAMAEIEIELKAGENTIMLSNPTYYAPDIDRIAVAKEAN